MVYDLQVGFAAVSTSVANYMICTDPAHALAAAGDAAPHAMDMMHKITAYLGTLIGAVTLTGSAVAFGKLHGLMPSAPLNLPQKNQINVGLAAGSLGAGATFLATGSPALGVAALTATTASGGALGYHLTASIGGADMPVVITLLNSYSGYALAAEGFMMNNDLLVTVGALIGSSGVPPCCCLRNGSRAQLSIVCGTCLLNPSASVVSASIAVNVFRRANVQHQHQVDRMARLAHSKASRLARPHTTLLSKFHVRAHSWPNAAGAALTYMR